MIHIVNNLIAKKQGLNEQFWGLVNNLALQNLRYQVRDSLKNNKKHSVKVSVLTLNNVLKCRVIYCKGKKASKFSSCRIIYGK